MYSFADWDALFDLYNSHEGRWVWQDYLPQPASRSLASVLNKMLQNATSKRYDSATQILADISSFERQATIQLPHDFVSAELGDSATSEFDAFEVATEPAKVLDSERTTAQFIRTSWGTNKLSKAPEKLIQPNTSSPEEQLLAKRFAVLASIVVTSALPLLILMSSVLRSPSYTPIYPPVTLTPSRTPPVTPSPFSRLSQPAPAPPLPSRFGSTQAAVKFTTTPEGQEAINVIRLFYKKMPFLLGGFYDNGSDFREAEAIKLPTETPSYRYKTEMVSPKNLRPRYIRIDALPKTKGLHSITAIVDVEDFPVKTMTDVHWKICVADDVDLTAIRPNAADSMCRGVVR